MEHVVISNGSDEQIELPPGFRFHPTDEELITHYLSKKVWDTNFNAIAIGEVDLNKCEPWDLPWRAKMGEKEWYFFCQRDRKYPTGLRTNRATKAGYWKATGKDKNIFRGKILVGMKKTLVFYGGRAPKGEKTDWVMHEYRLEGKYSIFNLPKSVKDEWVICRAFNKSGSCAKKAVIDMMKIGVGYSCPYSEELEVNVNSLLPALTDVPAYKGQDSESAVAVAHVTCFSNIKEQEEYSKMKNTPESSIPLGLNMNQQDYITGSLMQLLQSNIGYGVVTKQEQNCIKKMVKDQMLSSISQETEITSSYVNTEISYVNAQGCLWGY